MKQCSKCNGQMSLFAPMPQIEMHMCRDCKGIWFPKGMLELYLKSSLPFKPATKLSETNFKCRACKGGTLMTTHVQSTVQLVVDVCSQCEGIFLDANELKIAKNIAIEKPATVENKYSKPISTHSTKPAHGALFNNNQRTDKISAIDLGLLAYSNFFVKQRKEWTEIVVNLETRNRYDIFDPNGIAIGSAEEHAHGTLGFFKRLILGSHRPFAATIRDMDGGPQLEINRPFFFFLSDMYVTTSTGVLVGSIHRRFAFLHTVYSLKDGRGREFATIKRPLWRLWLFEIKDQNENNVGKINKKWGGALRELFSSADSFEVAITNANFNDFQRALILAASIAIDFDHFENQSKN